MITLQLIADRVAYRPLLYVSPHCERNRVLYCDHVPWVSSEGAREEWVHYFLRGVHLQALDGAIRIADLRCMAKDHHGRVETPRSSALLPKIIDRLFSWPATTAALTANELKISHRAAQNNIDRLVDAGILREVTGKRWGRVQAAVAIMEKLQGPPSEERLAAAGQSPEEARCRGSTWDHVDASRCDP